MFSDTDMQWFAARLAIVIHDINREYRRMGVGNVKAALSHVPGISGLTMQSAPNGGEIYTLNGKTVTLPAGATPAQIEDALVATPLPVVSYPASQGTPTPMPTPAPGSFAASLRAMMDEARAGVAQARTDGLAKVSEAVGKLGEAKSAVVQVTGSMAKTISDEADSVMAELGQISNMPPSTE